MSHFARIDENNIVQEVIVAEQDFINSGAVGDPIRWIQTSYNTRGGDHILGGVPFRKNYAGVGYSYDSGRDAFIPPRPEFGSWVLEEKSCSWVRPKPYPVLPNQEIWYTWNEEQQDWVETTDPLLMGR